MVKIPKQFELVHSHGGDLSELEVMLYGDDFGRRKRTDIGSDQWPGMVEVDQYGDLLPHLDAVRRFEYFVEASDPDVVSEGLSYQPLLSRSFSELSEQEKSAFAVFTGNFTRYFGWSRVLGAMSRVIQYRENGSVHDTAGFDGQNFAGKRKNRDNAADRRILRERELLIIAQAQVFRNRRALQLGLLAFHAANSGDDEEDLRAFLDDTAIVGGCVLHGNDSTIRTKLTQGRVSGIIAEHKIYTALPLIGYSAAYARDPIDEFTFKKDLLIRSGPEIRAVQVKGNYLAALEIAAIERRSRPPELSVATGPEYPPMSLSDDGRALLKRILSEIIG